MNHTASHKALLRLCQQSPKLREKLAKKLAILRAKKAYEDPNYMILQSLLKISERAPEILKMIGSQADELEDWQEFKIHLAAEAIDSVYDSIRFRLNKENL